MTEILTPRVKVDIYGSRPGRRTYLISEIVTCMRISARMLEMADGGRDKNYHGQAKLLRAAADDLEERIKP